MTPRRILRLAFPALVVIGVLVAIRQFGVGATVERDGLTFADASLAQALDRSEGAPGVRVLADFEDPEKVPCRAFIGSEVSGIACKERGGWHLRLVRRGVTIDDPGAVSATESSLRQAASRMAEGQ